MPARAGEQPLRPGAAFSPLPRSTPCRAHSCSSCSGPPSALPAVESVRHTCVRFAYTEAPMLTGTVQWTAQERVIHGKPAAEAVPAEMERIGAKRVLLLTTRSLAESRLVREVASALGDRCVGRFSELASHSPREAVVAGALRAREVDADHLLAVGGGSVTDATKTMLVALWRGVSDVEKLSSLAAKRGAAGLALLDSDRIRMTAVPTTLSAAEFTATAGV